MDINDLKYKKLGTKLALKMRFQMKVQAVYPPEPIPQNIVVDDAFEELIQQFGIISTVVMSENGTDTMVDLIESYAGIGTPEYPKFLVFYTIDTLSQPTSIREVKLVQNSNKD